ncbi:MAG: hypothetical protein ACODAU_12040 [Myxococcota bacterium]
MARWAALLLVSLVPAAAVAEDWHWRRGAPSDLAEERGGVGAELALGGTSGTFAASPMLGGWWLPAEHWVLSLDWGATFVRDGDATRGIANPLLTAAYAVETNGVRAQVGLQAAPPAARVGGDDWRQEWEAQQIAAFLRGGWNRWMWLPEMLAFAVPIHVESLRDDVHVAMDMAFAGAVHPADPETWQVVAQGALEGGYRDAWGAAGLRLQLVWLANDLIDDPRSLQTSLEPFLRVAIGDGYLSMRATLNLDAPFGFAGANPTIWGLHLGAGATL